MVEFKKVMVVDSSENEMPSMDTQDRPGFQKITDGTTEVSVTTDGALETTANPFKGKTLIVKTAAAGNTTTTIHTVTSGKTFFLVAASVSSSVGTDTSTGRLLIDDVIVLEVQGIGAASGVRGGGQISLGIAAPIPVAAGVTFKVAHNDVTGGANGQIIGWEE